MEARQVKVQMYVPNVKSPLEAVKAMTYDARTRYIYTGLMLSDMIDCYLVELKEDVKNANLFRQGFKKHLKAMQTAIESYKQIMYNQPEAIQEQLVDKLDLLFDEFHNDIKLFYLSTREFVRGFAVNPDHATCIARASVIEVLSQYSLLKDRQISRGISNMTFRSINIEDGNLKTINFNARRFISEFSKIYGDVEINLNACELIFNAFKVIDSKASRIEQIINHE